jgi:hypothetical protein
MAFGGMEALQRQVDEMGIHWGNGPQHVKQNFANAYGKLSALKKLVNHMETKDFDSANSRLSDTPDQALQSVMDEDKEDEAPLQVAAEQDEGVEAAQEAALHQRGRRGQLRLHSFHLGGQLAAAGVTMPPFMGQQRAERQGAAYDPALKLSAANRRRLAQRAAIRVGQGDWKDSVVSPPWTR